jgi:UDP-N-acetylmuramoyl-L-alanyl-D-glutamate--2,6-diaminopimelate ligase
MLSQLLNGVIVRKMFQTMYGKMVMTHDVQVNSVRYDSRKVEHGDLFVAIRGSGFDGHRFIPQAVAQGAKVVVVEDDAALPDSWFMHAGIVKVVVPESRTALALISANYFGRPSDELVMVGVTGTNGKTTTTHLLRSILEGAGNMTGLLGTIEYRIGSEILPATHTTPESLELNELLAQMVERRCTAAVMEVSSHALRQHRVEGMKFRAAVFTNLTQDHLDYHGTMDDYFGAKKILFDGLSPDAYAVVNADDPWGTKIIGTTQANKLTYGMTPEADVSAKNVKLSMQGSSFIAVHTHEETPVDSSLVGRFNVSNMLAAFATGIALGIPKAVVKQAIRDVPSVRGRFETIVAPEGWTAVIDYAHTPDALQKALLAIQDIFDSATRGKLITIFGCGGNRDRGKRPKMAAIATGYSDLTIVTSDNPRHENPEAIIDEIMTGVKAGSEVLRIPDRKKAILKALELTTNNGVVLIAGKGHEDYQVIGDEKIHFSDREVVEAFLRSRA